MREHGIKARGKRKFVVTTDSKHNLPIAPNLLNRNFRPIHQAACGRVTSPIVRPASVARPHGEAA